MRRNRTVERPVFANVARPRGESRALVSGGGLAARVAGAFVVLACIALPLALGALATSIEQAAGDTYVRALGVRFVPSHSLVNVAAGVARPDRHPRLLDQQYYFVNGCVAASRDCAGTGAGNWGEYYAELHRLYDRAVLSAGYEQPQPFDDWAAQHAHFVVSKIAPAGAAAIARALAENHATGDIHIIGTSAGGAAVFTYLSQAMRGDVPTDRRIHSVITVDSPLGNQIPFESSDTVDGLLNGFQASAMKTDVQPGLGTWAKAAGIAILTVDSWQDIVGFNPLPDIADDSHPVYSQSDTPAVPRYLGCTSMLCKLAYLPEFLDQGSTWHIYTGSHMANSARQFIDDHWR